MPELLPSRIVTPRLVLRRWHHDEANALSVAIAMSIEHLRPWLPWTKFEPLTRSERVALIERWTRDWEDGRDAVYGVFLDGEVIGQCGLHRRTGVDTIDIGYWIHADHLRCGYATELTVALTTAAFETGQITLVRVQTDAANVASAAVPARLGFTQACVIERQPQASAESGRLIDWTMRHDAWNPDDWDRDDSDRDDSDPDDSVGPGATS